MTDPIIAYLRGCFPQWKPTPEEVAAWGLTFADESTQVVMTAIRRWVSEGDPQYARSTPSLTAIARMVTAVKASAEWQGVGALSDGAQQALALGSGDVWNRSTPIALNAQNWRAGGDSARIDDLLLAAEKRRGTM